ncbi:MAG: HAD family phosphatase [Lachnospiraceae bacterium]|nr:HAD family phosphatase [Lachnospiraceae bacterium]
MIKNIIFDIGMVLADFRYAAYMRDDLGFSDEVVQIFSERLVLGGLWDELDLGIRETEDIINEMKSRVSEYPREAELFFGNLEDIIKTYPYSRPWVQEMKSRGYGVYLLSNYPRDTYRMHEKKHFDFAPYVDGKVISGFERISKPDHAIYRLLFDRYGLEPNECVFLDDRKINVDAARAVGMQAIVFTSYEDARKKLEEILKTSG